MLKLFQGLSRWLANYTSIFVIGVAVFTFFFPHTFDWVRGTTQTVILGIIMLTMGLTLTTNDFKILAQRPLDVFIGACAQFIIMPGVAYTLVHVWHLDPALSLGILLVGCCPGGVSSNIMSYLCHGDVAFSVGIDLCLYDSCACDDSAADEDYGWRDYPCRCCGNVHQYSDSHDYSCGHRLRLELYLWQEGLLPYHPESDAGHQRNVSGDHRGRRDFYGSR